MNYLYLVFFIFIYMTLGACKKPLPEPHLNDYIYQSLKQELATTESRLNDILKQHNEFINKSKDPSLSISDIKIARAKADVTLREIRKLEQRVKYWKLKLLSREELVRSSYLDSFNKGEEWNNEEEILRFKRAHERGKPRSPSSTKKSEHQKESITENSHSTSPEENETEEVNGE